MNGTKLAEEAMLQIDAAGHTLPLSEWAQMLETIIAESRTRLDAAKDDLSRRGCKP